MSVVTVSDLRAKTDQLVDALNVYDRFVEGWPYESEAVPAEIEGFLEERSSDMFASGSSPEIALATEIKELYYEAREVEAAYIQQARERGRTDWSRLVSETEPIRDAARRVHTAGYGNDAETGEPDYLLPRERCPASLVSMNTGSSPITYEDRVVQYRAIADYFDLSPGVVYHPGSGHDVSLSEAFPGSRVVYADVDEAAMTELHHAGYEAVGTDAAGYELAAGADMVLFRNAGLLEEAIVSTNLRSGGWVLANDHLESARHLVRMDSLELVGVVPDTWTGDTPTVDTSDLNAYLTRLKPDEMPHQRRRKPTEESVDNEKRSCPGPVAVEEKGTPLDLYVFRDDS